MAENYYSINAIKQHLEHREGNILGHENFLKSAVLLPLVEINNTIHVLFEVRSEQLRRQPGEICFPGGKVDDGDHSEKEAAIRETCEELGLQANQIELVAELDFIMTPFNFIIYPFVGYIKDHEPLKINHAEVADVFYVPLDYLLETKPETYSIHFEVKPEDQFPFHLIANGKDYNWRTRDLQEYFYFYKDRVIWGLTARILHHFLTLITK